MAETPKHYIRIDDDLWAQVKAKAAADNTTPSELIRKWMVDYVDDVTTNDLQTSFKVIADQLMSLDGDLKGVIAQLIETYRRL